MNLSRKIFVSSLRQNYGDYKAQLAKREEELMKNKQFGAEYAKYWKFIEGTLNKELFLFHTITLLVYK